MRTPSFLRVAAAIAAVTGVSILSGCYHRHRDPVYVEHVDVKVHDDHHEDHRDHWDDRR